MEAFSSEKAGKASYFSIGYCLILVFADMVLSGSRLIMSGSEVF